MDLPGGANLALVGTAPLSTLPVGGAPAFSAHFAATKPRARFAYTFKRNTLCRNREDVATQSLVPDHKLYGTLLLKARYRSVVLV
jgi:hypothetical protein